jgi:hypothetical protein
MVWCLDFHAAYRCRHAGACCRAGWPIPFEDGTVAARDAPGGCTFHDAEAQRCSLHRAGGLRALPLTCRMFPRIVLHDARGTFVSLSHFCPTAASLLFDGGGAAIVEAPPGLADVGELDGLDARAEWPPLLRPGVLMDLDSYAAWEARAVAALADGNGSPRAALTAVDAVTQRITAWTPGAGALLDAVHASFDQLPRASPPDRGPAISRDEAAVGRWLAARLFGAWTAYQGHGLAATLRHLRACLDVLETECDGGGSTLEAIRRSDLRILHGPGDGPDPLGGVIRGA